MKYIKIKALLISILINILVIPIVIGQNLSQSDSVNKITHSETEFIISRAIGKFKIKNATKYFSEELKKDITLVEKNLKSFKTLIGKPKEVNYDSKEAEREGKVCLLKFESHKKSKDTFEVKYFLLEKNENLILTEIQFKKNNEIVYAYPEANFNISKTIEELESLNETKEYQRKIELYEELIELSKFNIRNNILFFKDPVNTLSEFYGGKSWYYCLINEGNQAVLNAQIGLELDKSNDWIITNLALGNLIAGNYENAEKLYLNYMNKEVYPDTKFKDVFLQDIEYVKSLGIKIEGVDKILSLLKE